MTQFKTLAEAQVRLPEIAPEVSVFLKPLYRLFQEGNPIDPVTVVYYPMGDGKRLPFASVSKTRGNRLILWPAVDARVPGEFRNGDTFAIHHVTLELSNYKTHFTRFDPINRREHKDPGWTLAAPENGLSMWLIGAFQIGLLEQQVGAWEQDVRMPSTDSDRRLAEFKRYVAGMKHVNVVTPPLRGDSIVTAISLIRDSGSFAPNLTPDFPMERFGDEWIEGWPDGDQFPIGRMRIDVGGVKLLFCTASPLGRMRAGCFLGSTFRRRG